MTDRTGPLKLVPRYVEKPWGGRRMEEAFGRNLSAGAKIGESWELYDRPEGAAGIANGALAGRTVADLRGKRRIPLLTKLIDAMEPLSVQVHPDLEAAQELDGEEKTEAWYILDAAPGAKIYKGLRDGVGVRDLLQGIETETVEELLHSFEPAAGDVIYLPAGTVHAIGAGILLFEVQQNSDTTYRLHDWNRPGLDGKPRELHTEAAIRSTDFAGLGIDRVEARLISDDGRYRRTSRVDCPAFAMEEQEILGLVTFETERRGRDRWHVVFILSGEGTIRAFQRGAEEVFFAPGDSLLLPAEHESYEIEPRSGRTVRLLSVHQP